MKKFFTFLIAVGLVTAASAQTRDSHRNDSRSNTNSYQTSPNSNYDRGYSNQYNDHGYSNQYSNQDQYNRNSQWNDKRDHDWVDRDRQREERERYEMSMRRNQATYQYRNGRRYDDRSNGVRFPVLGLLSLILRK